mmetsp:Transcript_2563/g.3701  ORF Transcript_2563/g.3701 Transcript_2563/m.3701 type:complete len:372 (+) Transcript_2563:167-1282(+)|eukprot:CAMPEP_0167761764 /NCGR_PEP_ID=MMETSP0110_2-20121227/12362_1 /TAXON_ID=629695 /ORGANISM="Gymnochlora sp., Strain CCMP2014" /LENGTH=371 /DNA_ID=CAMNT_0007648501 /DNA_START=152 /DNA_END=1267 /DNA_ORIENTATION=-
MSEGKNATSPFTEKILISQHVFVEGTNLIKKSKILECAETNDVEGIVSLLNMRCDPNVEDEDGWSPLHWMVKYENTKLVAGLLHAKADPDYQNKDGQTPLHWAVDSGSKNMTIIKLLVNANANPNLRDIRHFSPFEIATLREFEDIMKLLKEMGADESSFKSAVSPSSSLRAIRVMNRAKSKLNVTYIDSTGKTKVLELGPGNAERIPINCELMIRPRSKSDSAKLSKATKKKAAKAEFYPISKDERVILCNLKSKLVSGMQCMLYVTPKDHPKQTYKRRVNIIHRGSLGLSRISLSSGASEEKGHKELEFRMLCIGSWATNEEPQAEAYRLFRKYALHEQTSKKKKSRSSKSHSLRSETMKGELHVLNPN